MDYVVRATELEIDHLEQLDRAMDKAVDEALQDALSALKIALFEKDEGEGFPADKPEWLPDSEAVTGEKDTWARGAVPIRKKIHLSGGLVRNIPQLFRCLPFRYNRVAVLHFSFYSLVSLFSCFLSTTDVYLSLSFS